MLKIIIYSVIFFFMFSCNEKSIAQNKRHTVEFQANTEDPSLKLTLEDINSLLNKAKKETDFSDKKLNLKCVLLNNIEYSECFSIQSNEEEVQILSSSINGIKNGLYEYLYQLGYRFYLPGEVWTYIPTIETYKISDVTNYCPRFDSRNFFGTGGFPKGPENKKYAQDWKKWSKRNRFGGKKLSGHSWQKFVKTHSEALDKNRDYLALVDGKRVDVKPSAKLCISNKDLRKLYANYMTEKLREKIRKQPNAHEYILSVDPSDGGGHCTCDKCSQMGTVSDRVFLLANTVAKEFQEIDDRAFVNLYAYNKHAYPIDFTLEPNIYVQVIPYAFNNYGNDDELISKWNEVSNHTYIYDYWNIPDWAYDLTPNQEYSLNNLDKRIEKWAQKTEGYNIETSYTKFTNGILLHFLALRSWDKNTSSRTFLKEFTEKMFPSNPITMELFFNTLLNENLTNTEKTKKLSQILTEFSKAKLTDNEKNRVEEIESYIQYLFLFEKVNFTKNAGDLNLLLHHISQTKDQNIIHHKRIANLLKRRKFKKIYTKNSSFEPSIPTLLEIDQSIAPITKKNTSTDKSKISVDLKKNQEKIITIKNRVNWFFIASRSITPIKINTTSNKEFQFELVDLKTGQTKTWDDSFTPKVLQELSLSTTIGHPYSLHIKNINWYKIEFPSDLLLWLEEYPHVAKLGDVFIANNDQQDLLLQIPEKDQPLPNIYSLNGEKLKLQRIDKIGTIKVSGSKGKIIVIRNYDMKKISFPASNRIYINSVQF